jgi:RNA polymerase sigma-70 factor, ECF subfamily
VAVQAVVGLGVEDKLLASAKAGDHDCFARLIEPQIALGYRLAVSMVSDPGLAEDVVQDSTIRAWRGLARLRSTSSLRPWFLSIVANRARSLRTNRWWSVLVTPIASMRAVESPEDSDDRADLQRAVRRLQPEERAAIFLRFYEDMTSQEISQVLRISPEGVRSRIHRALKRLRVELAEEEL